MAASEVHLEKTALRVLPAGVNSLTRLIPHRKGHTHYLDRGKGACVRDRYGRWYVDMHMGAGSIVLGHNDLRVQRRIVDRLRDGLCFASSHPLEPVVAAALAERFTSLEKVRFVASGTEAAIGAVGVARAATGRTRILAFSECYHGWALPRDPDVMLMSMEETGKVLTWIESEGRQLAAVLIEPVPASQSLRRSDRGFLKRLEAVVHRNGALLIFDEVITGMRLAYGGAATVLGITPDLMMLGKALGAGMPLAVYGGRSDVMSLAEPHGAWRQGGTLSGHPLALEAAKATLDLLDPKAYGELELRALALETQLREFGRQFGVTSQLEVVRVGSLLSIEGRWYTSRSGADPDGRRAFLRGHEEMMRRGIYLQSAPNKPLFLSLAHHVEQLALVGRSFAEVAAQIRVEAQ